MKIERESESVKRGTRRKACLTINSSEAGNIVLYAIKFTIFFIHSYTYGMSTSTKISNPVFISNNFMCFFGLSSPPLSRVYFAYDIFSRLFEKNEA